MRLTSGTSNILLPVAMLVYTAVAALLCFAFGRGVNFLATLYCAPFYWTYALCCVLLVVIVGVRSALGTTANSFLGFPGGWRLGDLTRRLIAAAPFLAVWPLFMAGFTAIKNLLNDTIPFTWDPALSDLDRLFFDSHPWAWLHIENPAITRAIEVAYAGWGLLLVVVPMAVALMRPTSPARTRFLVSLVLIFILLGNVAAGSFMSAGPFWFGLSGAAANDYTDLFAYLNQTNSDGNFSAVFYQRYLWDAYLDSNARLGTGISAFPSVHVAVATLYLLHAWKLGLFPRIAAALFLAAILIGSVHLGWHYALDGYAGIIGAALIYAAVGALQRRHARLLPKQAESQSATA